MSGSAINLENFRLGAWEDLEWPDRVDVLMTDPPYSNRTHTGMRPERSDGYGGIEVDYSQITSHDAWDLACRFAPMVAHWAIVFSDHLTFEWHAAAWLAQGLYVFPPVPYVKTNGSPRMKGDGPASVTEWIMVARPRGRLRDPGSRRGFYSGPTERTPRGERRAAGHKPGWLLRQILADYSRPGDWIADPYAGTATIGAAAIGGGRNYTGAEVDPETFKKGSDRLARVRAQPALIPAHGRQVDLALGGGPGG